MHSQDTAASTWLSPDELRTAGEGMRHAAARRETLTSALAWYVAVGRPAEQAPNVASCTDAFLHQKQIEGCRAETLRGYRTRLRKFAERFGQRIPAKITPRDVASFIQQWEKGVTRATWWQTLHTFFGWAQERGYAIHNPLPLAMQRPLPAAGQRELYTPVEARFILRRTMFTGEIVFWSLALFSGLRTAEIERLLAYRRPWDFIRLSAGVIDLPGECSKTGPRLVPMLPVLRSWLRWIRDRRIPLDAPNRAEKAARVRRAVRERRNGTGPVGSALTATAGSHNMARRSYISYRLALPGASYLEVAQAAGNHEPTLRKFYRVPVSRDAACAYFRLTPRVVRNA